jgi:serine protease Do
VRFIKQHFFGLLALIVSVSIGWFVLANGTEDVINLTTNQLDSTVFVSSTENRTIGSGVFINKDGMVVTNAHVVGDSIVVQITLRNKEEIEGWVIFRDVANDLAVIQLMRRKDIEIRFSNFECGRVPSFGEIIIAIGHPLGLKWTVTKGIISNNERILARDVPHFYQTDALIYFGNSGGPVFDIFGKIIGIAQSVYSYPSSEKNRVPTGHGFMIPSPRVCSILKSWNIELN